MRGRVRYSPNCSVASMQNSCANLVFHSFALPLPSPLLLQQPLASKAGNRAEPSSKRAHQAPAPIKQEKSRAQLFPAECLAPGSKCLRQEHRALRPAFGHLRGQLLERTVLDGVS